MLCCAVPDFSARAKKYSIVVLLVEVMARMVEELKRQKKNASLLYPSHRLMMDCDPVFLGWGSECRCVLGVGKYKYTCHCLEENYFCCKILLSFVQAGPASKHEEAQGNRYTTPERMSVVRHHFEVGHKDTRSRALPCEASTPVNIGVRVLLSHEVALPLLLSLLLLPWNRLELEVQSEGA